MNMRTHVKTDKTSFANSFLLLVVIAGVLSLDLFGSDAVSGYHDHKVLHYIELVFNVERSDTGPSVFSIFEDISGNDVAKDYILPLHFYTAYFGNVLFVIQKTGQVNTRPFYSFHNHIRLFNIPHQNSDEDEAFILQVDVA